MSVLILQKHYKSIPKELKEENRLLYLKTTYFFIYAKDKTEKQVQQKTTVL